MLVFPRFSHHALTGRLTDHRDTSYAFLGFLLLASGLLLASWTLPAVADQCGGAQTGATSCSTFIRISAVVPPPRPNRPAIITSPSNGQSFSTNPVTVSGTCPSGELIKVFTNGILVGSVICGASGQFSVPVDLVIGQNVLTALPFNTLDQQGPTSPSVTVNLNQPPGGIGYSNELILQSVNYYRGVEPGQQINWPIDIVGGQAPYAVSIDWGDGTSDLITRLAPGPFTMSHTYKTIGTGYLGTFPLIIRATDSLGHIAYLQLTTLVNAASAGASGKPPAPIVNQLMIIWPIWIVLLLMVISFWLGEKREKHIMQKQLAALA